MIRLLIFLYFLASTTHAINSQSYFKDSIQEYKKDFHSRGFHNRKTYPTSRQSVTEIKYNSYIGPDVPTKIDALLIPASNKKNLLVFQSGVHGIEGLTGAGIQSFLLEYLPTKNLKDTSVLYLHLVNPAGTFLGRRTNLNNVDLNRNFVVSATDYGQKSEDYAAINFFLNPESSFASGFFKKASFYFQALYLIYNHSIDTLRRSILKGQYSFPKGLYYGGDTYQPEFHAIKTIWDTELPGYEKIVYVDLHTGYGEKGKLHLLAGDSESELGKKLQSVFSPTDIDFGNSKNFYQTTGDVLTYFEENYKKYADVYPITFEFGTLNSQSTLGSLDSLYRMISENQAHWYKTDSENSKSDLKKLFKDMFYPSDFEWRDKVLSQTKREVDKILKFLEPAH